MTLSGEVALLELDDTWTTTVPYTPEGMPIPKLLEVVAGNPSSESQIGLAEARVYEMGVSVGDVIQIDSYPAPPPDLQEGPCTALEPLDYLTDGAEVSVSDAGESSLIGLGRLAGGRIADNECVFAFAVELAREADFYEIQVGGDRPGDVEVSFRYTQAEIEALDYNVRFSR